jgi:predicted glutamine amidotransferase
MCRLLAFAGDNYSEFARLFNCLRRVAENDPLKPKDPVHGDGWGFALVNEKGIEYYRTHRAIFKDTLTPQFEGYSLIIVHARQTSFEDLVSSKHFHPYNHLTP